MRKTQKQYFENFDHKKITDDKSFWKTIKPFFINKGINKESITLVENGETPETLSNCQKISKTLKTFFSDAVKNLGIPQYEGPTVDTSDISDPFLKAISKYKNHSSVRRIKNNFKNLSTFSFSLC